MSKIDKARQIIDEVDSDIAKAFEKRFDAITQIIQEKADKGLPIYDPKREKELLSRLKEEFPNKEYEPYYEKLVACILELSKAYQEDYLNQKKTESD